MVVERLNSKDFQWQKLLEFGLETYHESWKSVWGASIEVDHVRTALIANPRLSKKIQMQIEAFIENELLSTEDGLEEKLEPKVEFIPGFLQIAGQETTFKDIGLAWNSRVVKKMMVTELSGALVSEVGQKGIRKSLSYLDVSPVLSLPTDLNTFIASLEMQGINCLVNWIRQFPKTVAIKLIAVLPKTPETIVTPSQERQAEMIKLVNSYLSDVTGKIREAA